MTEPVSPPAPATVPPYPALGSANFNMEAYNFGSSMPGVVANIAEQAQTAYENAVLTAESSRVAELAADRAALSSSEALTASVNADLSASNANTAKLAAEAALDSFDDRYLGAKSADPATDNDGNPVIVGALYFRTTAPIGMKVKTVSGWDDAYANLASKYDKTGGDITGPVGIFGLLTVKSPSAGVAGKISFQNSFGGADLQIGKSDVIGNWADISHSASGGVLNISQSGAGTVNTLVNNTVVQEVTTAGVRVISGSLGYGVGSGGAVVQATSKSTAITLNKPSGQITMNNGALGANATVAFSLNNTFINGESDLLVKVKGGSVDNAAYQVWAFGAAVGSIAIAVRNISNVTLSESVVLEFKVIQGANS